MHAEAQVHGYLLSMRFSWIQVMRKVDFLKNVEKIKEKVKFSGCEVSNSGRRGAFRSRVFVLALRVFLAVIRLTIDRQCEVEE